MIWPDRNFLDPVNMRKPPLASLPDEAYFVGSAARATRFERVLLRDEAENFPWHRQQNNLRQT
ncbi:hypothetical protein [Aquamicrobium sp. LC103]|uniref:hypothetical protein n=1 Tax=Aquamicrobium sp. LC103 TaxID=1120658 RepID=UPI00063E7C49|nr:hypothetical protein [Aquamicrobium sp. LC103]TKT79271.1 hypothetical protein XW59_010130 [Aquamicrobium sp. LC103]